jgi:hypothetical protein
MPWARKAGTRSVCEVKAIKRQLPRSSLATRKPTSPHPTIKTRGRLNKDKREG